MSNLLSMQSSEDQQMNALLTAAFLLQRCKGCPNRKRVLNYYNAGVYPRWGAGTINAPIIIILERPGDQYYLCETGMTLDSLAVNVTAFRQAFTEIMFAAYEDGVRFLEGILEFLYGKKARQLSYISRIELLSKLVYITEIIKCPGRNQGKNETRIKNICPKKYFKEEWRLLSQLQSPPTLVIIATGLIKYFPSNFPSKVREMKINNHFTSKSTHFLRVRHPSSVKYVKKIIKNEWRETVKKFGINTQTDLNKSVLTITAYLLHQLINLPASQQVKIQIDKRVHF